MGRGPTSSNLKIAPPPVRPLVTDFSFVFWVLICVLCLANACHDCEVEMNTPHIDAPRTPTKLTGNDGAGADNHNDSTESEDSSDSDLPQAKPKRRRAALDYVLIKEWVTGEKATMADEDIENELFNAAREWMAVSLLRKLPGHQPKSTDVYSTEW